jgi:hypothetical protein
MTKLPLDETVKVLRYHSINLGEQAIIRMEGSNSILIVANPNDGRRPYFYYRDRDFTDMVEIGRFEDEGVGNE